MSRETSRFEWRRGVAVPAETRRLEFRTLDEVGEAAFVDAIARVSEGTLDREISAEREELGVREAARQFFELELQLEHDPAWCQLAYTPSGDLVGLVMPAKNPTTPVINYIGVVPEQRGRGYVDDLLARGTGDAGRRWSDRHPRRHRHAKRPHGAGVPAGRIHGVRPPT